MNKIKFDNEKKMCLQVGTKDNGRTIWKKYKPYAIGELPTSFGFIYDEDKDMKGTSSWIKYKSLIYIAEQMLLNALMVLIGVFLAMYINEII